MMEYRQLGATSLRLPVAGFGAATFGDVYGQIDPAEANSAVHFAIDEGINYFDVSPYYGLTVAETRLGEALAGHRDRVVISTKCGRYGANSFDFSGRRIAASIDESLQRLRTDHVDLLLAHDVEFGNIRQVVDETIPAMRKIQQQGKARYIGISGYPLSTLVAIASQVPVDAVLTYCRYNLMIDDMDAILTPFAKKHNIGIVNASPLHMGVITAGGAPNWHPAPQQVREAGKRVVELCKARSVDAAEVALRYCFDYASVTSTLVGMATRKQVETCLKSLRQPNDPELLEEIRAVVAPVYNYVWPSGTIDADG
jgi:L-galactose dehydrogenase